MSQEHNDQMSAAVAAAPSEVPDLSAVVVSQSVEEACIIELLLDLHLVPIDELKHAGKTAPSASSQNSYNKLARLIADRDAFLQQYPQLDFEMLLVSHGLAKYVEALELTLSPA